MMIDHQDRLLGSSIEIGCLLASSLIDRIYLSQQGLNQPDQTRVIAIYIYLFILLACSYINRQLDSSRFRRHRASDLSGGGQTS
jgi:hypothetical protein